MDLAKKSSGMLFNARVPTDPRALDPNNKPPPTARRRRGRVRLPPKTLHRGRAAKHLPLIGNQSNATEDHRPGEDRGGFGNGGYIWNSVVNC